MTPIEVVEVLHKIQERTPRGHATERMALSNAMEAVEAIAEIHMIRPVQEDSNADNGRYHYPEYVRQVRYVIGLLNMETSR